MKLYYAPGTCSLAVHIASREAGIVLQLERVDIGKWPHPTQSGANFAAISANQYVPVLELDDRSRLTEAAALLQYLADLKPDAGLAPRPGTLQRVTLQSWLNFIATELHKTYSPWLFNAEVGAKAEAFARQRIAARLAYVEGHLNVSGPYLMGEQFTVADAYLFTILNWSVAAQVSLAAFPKLRSYIEQIRARPAVDRAMEEEGLKDAA